jgi:hypothetical protein
MSTARTPRRGEIWMVDFDPAVGAEILCVGVYASVNWRLDTHCGQRVYWEL